MENLNFHFPNTFCTSIGNEKPRILPISKEYMSQKSRHASSNKNRQRKGLKRMKIRGLKCSIHRRLKSKFRVHSSKLGGLTRQYRRNFLWWILYRVWESENKLRIQWSEWVDPVCRSKTKTTRCSRAKMSKSPNKYWDNSRLSLIILCLNQCLLSVRKSRATSLRSKEKQACNKCRWEIFRLSFCIIQFRNQD